MRAFHQHLGVARIGFDDAEPMAPRGLVAGGARQVAGDGMLLAELGELRLERLLDHPACRHGGEDLAERRAVEAERRGVIVAGRDQHRAALFDVAGDVLEIEQRQHAAPLVAVEDDQIELVELLLEQLAGGEGDQRELVDRRPVLLLRRPQNREVHEVDRGVGLEHVTPGALAGMRLAGHQQHAQVLAHALDREHGAIVDGGELARGRLGFDLDDIGAGVIDIDRDLDGLADADGPRHRRLALMGDGELDRAAGLRGRRVGDFDLDLLGAADNAEAWRAQDLEPAVELAWLAGQQRMDRRIEAKAGGGSGHVMHLAFGDHDHPGEPVGRHVGQELGRGR